MHIRRVLQVLSLALVAVTFAAVAAQADTTSFDVTLNTSSLSGTQTLLFGITDGDGVADNSVTLANFNFGAGSPLGSASISGTGISGDLASGIALDDSGFSALFSQQFTVGSSLSFLLNTSNAFTSGTPDAFAMYLCDADVSNCYSDDISTGALLVLNLTGSPLTPASFVLNGSAEPDLSEPVVTVPTGTGTGMGTGTGNNNVPEPSSMLLALCGLTGLALVLGRKTGRRPMLAV